MGRLIALLVLANIAIIVLGTTNNVITKYFKNVHNLQPFEPSSKLMVSKNIFPKAFQSISNSVAEDNIYLALQEIELDIKNPNRKNFGDHLWEAIKYIGRLFYTLVEAYEIKSSKVPELLVYFFSLVFRQFWNYHFEYFLARMNIKFEG